VSALPAKGTAGRSCAMEQIVIHFGGGRFGHVTRAKSPRTRAAIAPGAPPVNTFRAPHEGGALFSTNFNWAGFAASPWPTPAAICALFTQQFHDLQGGTAAFTWFASATLAIAPVLPIAPAPRARRPQLNRTEARRVLADAGFIVKNKTLEMCTAIIFSAPFAVCLEPLVDTVLRTRLQSRPSALVPAPSPPGASATPSYVGRKDNVGTRSYEGVDPAVTHYCDAAQGVILKAHLRKLVGRVAETRAFGMDVMRLAIALALRARGGPLPAGAALPDFASQNNGRAAWLAACLGRGGRAGVPHATLYFVLEARAQLIIRAAFPNGVVPDSHAGRRDPGVVEQRLHLTAD